MLPEVSPAWVVPKMAVVDSPPREDNTSGDPVVESSGLELPGAGDVLSENCAVDTPEGDDIVIVSVVDSSFESVPPEELVSPAGDVPASGDESVDGSVTPVGDKLLTPVSDVIGDEPLSEASVVAGDEASSSGLDVSPTGVVTPPTGELPSVISVVCA